MEKRILAIDYGIKRCGLAWTDPNQTFAFPLPPCATSKLMDFITEQYEKVQSISKVLIGLPLRFNSEPTHATPLVEAFLETLKKQLPECPYILWDERFTTKLAQQSLLLGGAPKSKRRDKELINSISATILLQNYLESLK